MGVVVRGIDFAAAFIDRAEDRFDARGRLRHERSRARRRNGQQGDVAAAYLDHFVVECRIGFADAADHRVIHLLVCIVYGECSAFGCHLDRCAVGCQSQFFLHLDREIDGFVRAVAQAQCRQHVAFGRDAQSVRRPFCAIVRIFFHNSSSTRRTSASSGSFSIFSMICSTFSSSKSIMSSIMRIAISTCVRNFVKSNFASFVNGFST